MKPICPHRTSESNGSYWVCCCCGEYLRDKLNNAYLERDGQEIRANRAEGLLGLERERAERAEALCDAVVQTYETRLARVRERAEADFDEVKAEHRDHLRMCDGRLDRLKQANAALVRVRALCDEASEDCPAWDQYNVAALVADIRAAIEGEQ